MLPRKRDTDDGNGEQQAKQQVPKRHPDTTCKYPDDIEDGGQAACWRICFSHICPKRHQRQQSYFKALQAKRNTNDGNAKAEAYNKIPYSGEETAKNQPDNISNQTHNEVRSFNIQIVQA